MAYHYRRKLEARKKKVRRLKALFILDGILLGVLLLALIGAGIKKWSEGEPKGSDGAVPVSEEIEEVKGKTEEKEEEPASVSITVSMAGDCTLGTDEAFDYETGFTGVYDSVQDPGYFFREVQSVFGADDLTIVNMEGTLTDSEYREEKQFAFKAPASYADILTKGSVEAANLANNHSRDYGEKSYTDTIAALDSAGIVNFGYDRTAVMDVKGVKVGLVGTYELAEHLGCKEEMIQNVESVKEQGAQVVVVSFHWGEERVNEPNSVQVELAHAAVDAGADLVVGHHPHVISGIEVYKGKNIVYSLGNFCFGGNSAPSDMDSFIFQQTFTMENGKLKEDNISKVIPCKISSAYQEGYNNYQPVLVDGEEKEAILQRIETYSQGLGTGQPEA